MAVARARGAVGCPARVRDADMRVDLDVQVLGLQLVHAHFGQLRHLSRCLEHDGLAGLALSVDSRIGGPVHGDTRRVVATILQTLQAIEQDLQDITSAVLYVVEEVAEDAAHGD